MSLLRSCLLVAAVGYSSLSRKVLKAGTEADTMGEHCLLACSQALDHLLFLNGLDTLPTDESAHNGPHPSVSINSQDDLPQTCLQVSLPEAIPHLNLHQQPRLALTGNLGCQLTLSILGTATPHPRTPSLHRLTRQLLRQYHKDVRPVYNSAEATTVYLDLCVHAVLDVDVQNQKLKTSVWYQEVWNDKFLSWNSSLFDDIQEISLPLSAIWAPDIIINEFVDLERSPDLPYVYVNSSGTISNHKPIQVVSACSLQTYAFPFDIQNCSLTFHSILHTVEDIDLGFLRTKEDIENDKRSFLNDSEWQLLSVSSTYHILRNSAGNFAQIQFNVVIRRCPLAYVVSLLIPSIFLMLVDLGSFYLPPNCRARIIFKTNVLVGYTVFRVNMSDEVPRSTGCTSLIGVFFTVCMALLVLSLSKSILLIKFLYEERHSGQERPLCLRGDSDVDESRLHLWAPSAETTESPVHQEHLVQSDTLQEVWLQLQSINNSLRTRDQVYQKEVDWLGILYHFDQLLFRIYLAVLGLYTVTLCTLWALWSRI